MITEIWFFITAVVFTIVGMSFKPSQKEIIINAIETTVDRLIADGYIKTRVDTNGELELMKYNEE